MKVSSVLLSVFEWAIQHPDGRIPPPIADLSALQGLLESQVAYEQVLQQTCQITAARLQLGALPLIAVSPLTVDNVFVGAAVLMLNNGESASLLLRNAREPYGWSDYLVRHGLIAPTRQFIADKSLEMEFLSQSPLTTLLSCPPPDQTQLANRARQLAHDLLAHPLGYQCLMRVFAAPVEVPAVRRWRAQLMEQFVRLGSDNQKRFVLDVYEAAMVLHYDEVMAQVEEAYSIILDLHRLRETSNLEQCISTAHWWKPLFLYIRSNINAAAERPYLGYGYRRGLKLYSLASKLMEMPTA